MGWRALFQGVTFGIAVLAGRLVAFLMGDSWVFWLLALPLGFAIGVVGRVIEYRAMGPRRRWP